MFGVEDLDIRRKKPVRNEDVSRALNEESDHEEPVNENNKILIQEPVLQKVSSPPQSIAALKTLPNPSSTTLNHTTFSRTRQLVQPKDSKLSLAN
jgi:hypothetical protein